MLYIVLILLSWIVSYLVWSLLLIYVDIYSYGFPYLSCVVFSVLHSIQFKIYIIDFLLPPLVIDSCISSKSAFLLIIILPYLNLMFLNYGPLLHE